MKKLLIFKKDRIKLRKKVVEAKKNNKLEHQSHYYNSDQNYYNINSDN